MKNYTDIEQSRKLAEFLPSESADMFIADLVNPKEQVHSYNFHVLITWGCKTFAKIKERESKHVKFIPCWSLATLFAILPNEIITDNRFECHYQIHIRKYDGDDNTTFHQIAYGNNRGLSGSWHDMINTGEKESLVDCCVQMILKLHELKFL